MSKSGNRCPETPLRNALSAATATQVYADFGAAVDKVWFIADTDCTIHWFLTTTTTLTVTVTGAAATTPGTLAGVAAKVTRCYANEQVGPFEMAPGGRYLQLIQSSGGTVTFIIDACRSTIGPSD